MLFARKLIDLSSSPRKTLDRVIFFIPFYTRGKLMWRCSFLSHSEALRSVENYRSFQISLRTAKISISLGRMGRISCRQHEQCTRTAGCLDRTSLSKIIVSQSS